MNTKVVRVFIGVLLLLLTGVMTLTMAQAQGERAKAEAPPAGRTLVFSSGFESGVRIEPPARASGEWRQSLRGADTDRHAWPDGLPGHFAYLVGASRDLDKHVATRIESVSGPKGAQTRALYQEVKQDDPELKGITRNVYTVLPRGAGFDQAYVRYWIKLQPDLATVMPPAEGSWRMLMEWREAEPGPGRTRHGYRAALYVMRHSGSPLVWKLEANDLLPRDRTEWTLYNKTAPVPIGEWFSLEAFWKRSAGRDGRIWVAVNGQTVFDHQGSTSKGGRLHMWHIFKVYTGLSSLARGPAYQWIDDVEVHSDVPRPAASAAPGPARSATAGAPGQGEPCPEGRCAGGLTCMRYYGIAGGGGPLFTSCEIPCGPDRSPCPEGQVCGNIADGPGRVCLSR